MALYNLDPLTVMAIPETKLYIPLNCRLNHVTLPFYEQSLGSMMKKETFTNHFSYWVVRYYVLANTDSK